MNKKTKIISGITLLGVITIAVVTPIVVVSQQNKKAIQKANDELKAILDEISDKKVIIGKGVDVSTKGAFKKAIINALKIEDKIKLNNEQLSKISLVSNLIAEVNVFKKITLKVNIDKANVKNDVIINVKIEKSAKAIANEKIKKDKALFNAFNDFKINGSKVIRIKDNRNIEDLKILTDLNVNPNFTIPSTTIDVVRKYAITTDKITGIATVTVTFSATNGDDATKTFTITGFKTTADENKEIANTKIATDKALITNYKDQKISGSPNQIANGLVTKAKLESLPSFNALPTPTPDVTRTYNISIDANGLATVTVTFSATHGNDATETFTISGFKTAKQVEQEKIDAITDIDLTWIVADNTILSSAVTTFGTDLPNTTLKGVSGLNVAFTKVSNADGTITIKATVSKTGFNPNNITKTISGYKTAKQVEQEKIDAIIDTDLTWISADSSILSSAVTTFGTDLPNTTLKGISGLNVAFTKVSNADGTITIKATVSKTGFNPNNITKTISGYKTAKQVEQEKIDAITDTDLTWIVADSSILSSAVTTFGTDLPNTTLKGVSGLNVAFTKVSNADGTITIKATVSKTGFNPNNITKTISGYKTAKQVEQEKIDAITDTDLTWIVADSSILSSAVTTFGTDLPNTTLKGVSGLNVAFTKVSNADGTITIKATVSKTGFNPNNITKTISGYKTAKQVEQEKIDAITDTDLTWIVADSSILSSAVTTFGTDLPNTTLKGVSGLNVAFTKVSNADGTITIKATVSKTGFNPNNITKTISGYKTAKQVEQEKIDAITDTDLTWISADSSILSSAVTTFGTDLPNTTLKGVSGLNVAFTKVSNADGTITIKATVSKTGFNPNNITKTISGFKTAKQVEQEKIDAITDTDLTWISADSSILSSAVTTFGTDLPNTTLKGVSGLNVAFTKVSNADGTITIKATVSKTGFNPNNITKTISGYKTAKQVEQEKIDAITDTDLTWIVADSSILSSAVTTFGTDLPNTTLKGVSGLNVAFTKVSNADGTITIKATVSKTGFNPNNITKTIAGYKTAKQVEQEKINAITDTDLTWISADSSILSSAVTTFGTDLPNTTLKGVSGLNVAFTKVSNADGTITIKATVSKSGFNPNNITKTISGYKTTADDAIATDKVKFNGFINKKLKTKIARINDGTINDKKQLEDLVLDDDNKLSLPPITKGVTRTYTITTDATTGKATVTITFSATNGRDDSTTFTISGFKTTDDDKKESIANEKIKKDKDSFNAFNDFKISGSKANRIKDNPNIKDLKILTVLNVNPNLTIPTTTPDVNREYAITTNATTGVATVTITFFATNGTDAIKTFKISGFKSIDDDAIANDKAQFDSFTNKVLKAKTARINDGPINDIQLEKLNLNDNSTLSLPPTTQDVKRSYTITTDAAGKATVIVQFSATNGKDDSTTFTISGFDTKKEKETRDKDIVKNAIQNLNKDGLFIYKKLDVNLMKKGKTTHEEVVPIIWKYLEDKGLTKDQLALITISDIQLGFIKGKYFQVSILNHGSYKKFDEYYWV